MDGSPKCLMSYNIICIRTEIEYTVTSVSVTSVSLSVASVQFVFETATKLLGGKGEGRRHELCHQQTKQMFHFSFCIE